MKMDCIAFTLIEMLVVIATMAALLVPLLSFAKKILAPR